jgi:peptide-N4-(N-acetyl-beta-glucosaminyl)asparagine amidase
VKKEVKSSGILKRYPGFMTMDCNRPPGFVEVMSLGGKDNMASASFEPNQNCPGNDNHTRFGNIEEASISADGNSGTESQETKRATAGGILHCQGHYFIMTAAHIFPEYSQYMSTQRSIPSEFDYEPDGGSDDEEMDDAAFEEIEQSEHVSTKLRLRDTKMPDESESQMLLVEPNRTRPPQDDKHAQVSATTLGAALHPLRLDNVDSADISQSTTGQTSSVPADISTRIQLHDGFIEPLSERFIDEKSCLLDYALLPISRSRLDGFTSGRLKEIQSQFTKVSGETSGGGSQQHATLVTAITASGGRISGQLLATLTFLIPTQIIAQRKLFTVKLQGTLEKGDSGSWIHDAVTGEVYGHLIAGSPQTYVYYPSLFIPTGMSHE